MLIVIHYSDFQYELNLTCSHTDLILRHFSREQGKCVLQARKN
jgi:hypothetical protein